MLFLRCFLLCLATTAFANLDSAKVSEALGHLIGKNLQSLDVPLDINAIAKGLQDESEGISSPMSDDACLETLKKLQEEQNIKEAAAFLEGNQKKVGVVALEGGKLQYEILKKGEGEKVQSYNSPLVRLKLESDHAATDSQVLALDEVFTGLKLGILGMREGEIRKLYIHPDLTFGKDSPSNSTNTLLVYEIELIEADASSDAHAASNADALPIFRDLDDVRPLAR